MHLQKLFQLIIAYSFQNILILAFVTCKIVSATPTTGPPTTDEEDNDFNREGKSKQITPKSQKISKKKMLSWILPKMNAGAILCKVVIL